jgi:hypothetical protein
MRLVSNERTAGLLARATSILIAVSSIGFIGIGAFAIINTARAKAAEAELNRLSRDLDDAKKSLAQARQMTKTGSRIEGPAGRPVVDSFQAAAETKAHEYGCTLECRVGDPALFISRFLNEPDSTLQQVEITMILRGPLDQVMRTLASFKTFNIPFEYGDLSLQRSTESKAFEQVTANLTAAVLIPSAAGGNP